MKREMIEMSADNRVRLNEQQEALLEQSLSSQAQVEVAKMVRALPTEEPDLMWRSRLSGRLHEVAAQRDRKRRIGWALRPVFGLGAAAALTIVFVTRHPVADSPNLAQSLVEAQVLSAHREAVQLESFWGSVRASEEARLVVAPAASEYQWDESDLGTL